MKAHRLSATYRGTPHFPLILMVLGFKNCRCHTEKTRKALLDGFASGIWKTLVQMEAGCLGVFEVLSQSNVDPFLPVLEAQRVWSLVRAIFQPPEC